MIFRIGLIVLVVFVAVGGCKPDRVVRSSGFGVVDPCLLDSSLTDDEIERMSKDMSDVPWLSVPLSDDANMPGQVDDVEIPADPQERKIAACKAYLHGRWLLNQNDFEGAVRVLSRGIACDADSGEMQELAARAYLSLGKTVSATQAAKKAILLSGDLMHAYRVLGAGYLDSHEYLAAASCFRYAIDCPEATEANPITAVLQLHLAGALSELGYLRASAQAYGECVRLTKKQSSYAQSGLFTRQLVRQIHLPLLTRAGIHIRMGEIAQAVEVLERAKSFFPEEVDFIGALARSLATQREPLHVRYRQVVVLCEYLLSRSGQVEKYLEVFYDACVKMDKHADYLAEVEKWYDGLLLSEREYAFGLALADQNDKAMAVLERAMVNNNSGEDTIFLYRDLARLSCKAHRWVEMARSYGLYLDSSEQRQAALICHEALECIVLAGDVGGVLDLFSNDIGAIDLAGQAYLLGYLAAKQDKPEIAEAFYRRALAIGPENNLADIALTELLLLQGKNEQVLDRVAGDGVVDSQRNSPEMLWYAGQACTGLGKLDMAAGYYRRVIEQRQDDIRAYLALAEVLYRQGSLSQAEEILLEVLANWPGDANVYEQLVILYVRFSASEQFGQSIQAAASKRAREMLHRYLASSNGVAQGTHDSAKSIVTAIEKVAKEYPSSATVGIMLSELYMGLGRLDDAIKQIEGVVSQNEENEPALKLAARLNESQGDWLRAAELRKELWYLNSRCGSLLDCLLAMRFCGQADEAAALLMLANKLDDWPNDEVIKLSATEARRVFMVSMDYDKAVELFESWYDYGRCYGEIDVAVQPHDSESLCPSIAIELTWALTQDGQYDEAIDRAKRFCRADAANKDSESVAVALQLAKELNIRGFYEQSLAMLGSLVELRADDLPLRMQLYLSMIESGDTAGAIAAATEWFQKQPEQSDRRNVLLAVLRQGQDYQAARELIERALAENIESSRIQQQLEIQLFDILLHAGFHDEARAIVDNNLSDDKLNGTWIDAKIQLHIILGQCDDALAYVGQLASGRKRLQFDLLRAQILSSCGLCDEAAEMLEKIVENDPDNTDAALQLSVQLGLSGRNEESLKVLEGLLERYPENAAIKNNLGYLLLEAATKHDLAEKLIGESFRAFPESMPTLDSLGWLYYKKGEFTLALQCLYQAGAGMGSVDYEVLDHIGDALYRNGRPSDAEWYWQRALLEIETRRYRGGAMQDNRDKIKNKLEQLVSGSEVTVAPLFECIAEQISVPD